VTPSGSAQAAARRRDRRHERHEATRQEIIDAAWKLVARDGFGALSMRALARAVGMEAQSLYTYFASKHAIFDAMFAEGNQTLIDRRRVLKVPDDPRQALHVMSRDMAAFCTEDRARYQLLFERPIPGFEPSPKSYAIATEVLDDARGRLAAAGFTDPSDLDLYTSAVRGLVGQQMSNEPGGTRWVKRLEEVLDMVLDHLEAKKRQRKSRTGKNKKQKGS
jgi:AcrR family transcriptional regulator